MKVNENFPSLTTSHQYPMITKTSFFRACILTLYNRSKFDSTPEKASTKNNWEYLHILGIKLSSKWHFCSDYLNAITVISRIYGFNSDSPEEFEKKYILILSVRNTETVIYQRYMQLFYFSTVLFKLKQTWTKSVLMIYQISSSLMNMQWLGVVSCLTVHSPYWKRYFITKFTRLKLTPAVLRIAKSWIYHNKV